MSTVEHGGGGLSRKWRCDQLLLLRYGSPNEEN